MHARAFSTAGGKNLGRLRRATAEPVLRRLEQIDGFRRLPVRGTDNAGDAWDRASAMHDLLELLPSGQGLAVRSMAAGELARLAPCASL